MIETGRVSPANDANSGPDDCLSTGTAGVALLQIERARSGIGPWETAWAWAATMTRSPVTGYPDGASLYRGTPAVAFVLQTAQQPAYCSALRVLDGHIATLTRHRLAKAHHRIDSGRLPALAEWDLISGLTGIGAHLLHRHSGGDLLGEVLGYLVRLTHPLRVGGEVLPGWWCGDAPGSQPAHLWAGGHGNLGMAHGIAGPLALLSTTFGRGVEVTGQAEAISRICEWLDQWRLVAGPHLLWPEMISRSQWRAGTVTQEGWRRPSWCYGTPGLARAQQLAALALGDRQRQRHAEQALAECFADEDQLSLLTDASLCHGWAGLIQTAWRVSLDAGGDSEVAARLPGLRLRMDQHLRRHGSPAHDGLLEGAAGIRLVQHTVARPNPPATRWDACLLLDG